MNLLIIKRQTIQRKENNKPLTHAYETMAAESQLAGFSPAFTL